jgi:hypothetical protein
VSVTIDPASATRLLAEGAIRFDTDDGSVTCEGRPIQLPCAAGSLKRPILVSGSCEAAVEAVAQELQARGLPAWRVLEPASPDCPASSEQTNV